MGADSIAQAVLFFSLLLAASLWDIQKRIIPDSLCFFILLTGFLTFTSEKLFGILLGLPLLIAALLKEGGMGGGDIKLTAASGFVLGFPLGIAGLILGLCLVILWYWGNRIVRKAERKALPMVPFLGAGFLCVYFFDVGEAFL